MKIWLLDRFDGPVLSAMTKYILVSGGVVSGIGKGVIGTCLKLYLRRSEFETLQIASSAGLLLKMTGLKVTAIKTTVQTVAACHVSWKDKTIWEKSLVGRGSL